MKLGFMVYSLGRSIADGTLDFVGAINHIRKCGAAGVDLDNWNTGGLPPAERAKITTDAGLAIASYIGGADFTMDDPGQRALGVDALRAHLDDAAAMQAPTVLLTTGVCAPGQDKAQARRNIAESLRQVLDHAAPLGIKVSIEDFGAPTSPYQTSAECLEVCEMAGPDLMMTYDSGNMVMGDEDSVDFLRAVAPRMIHAHAKDWELLPPDAESGLFDRSGRKYIATRVGLGVLDYPAIIGALKDLDYQGYLAFEYEGPGDQLTNALEGCAYLRDLIEA